MRSRAPDHARQQLRSAPYIVAAALVAFVLKLVIAANTFGTNDIITFYQFAKSLHDILE